jgi:MoaA/NifB/PqqE/SkfB family radical SAM enzyme
MKSVRTPTYKYNFNEKTGYFERWGKTIQDDPVYSPIGPEILDIEVSTICHQGCAFCYKSNTGIGKNMSLDTFKTILDKMPTITQVAFGIGSIDANPDLFSMMEYCRKNDVVPNVTVNGYRLTDEIVDRLSSLVGAIAVSNYNKNVCYNTVKRFTDKGLEQVNVHQLLSKETYGQCLNIVDDIRYDERLEKLNAVVFLSLKQKGRGLYYSKIETENFEDLIAFCLKNNTRFGFDSCTACKFIRAIKDYPQHKALEMMSEPCESGLFSSYINVDGSFFPCSFAEIGDGLDVVHCDDFLNDIWYHPKTTAWRKELLKQNRNCPLYDV